MIFFSWNHKYLIHIILFMFIHLPLFFKSPDTLSTITMSCWYSGHFVHDDVWESNNESYTAGFYGIIYLWLTLYQTFKHYGCHKSLTKSGIVHHVISCQTALRDSNNINKSHFKPVSVGTQAHVNQQCQLVIIQL